jgi:tetratricopeptide (TPR) repeat protein
MARDQAVALLVGAIGAQRVAAELAAAERLARLCDFLPLALAIVAERAQRTESLADVVCAVEDEKARLDNLGTGEDDPRSDMRAALSWSYQALHADAAAMFRSLGLHPASDIALDTAAALADLPVPQAKEALDQLVAAHLLEQRHPHRYQLHDLIRLYATEQVTRHESTAHREAAIGRVLDWYLHAANSADAFLLPPRRRDFMAGYEPRAAPPAFRGATDALAWFEQEHHSLRSVVAWAAGNGWAGHAWRTAMAMTSFFDARIPWHDGVTFYEAAFEAARAASERVGEAYTLNSLACIHLDKRDFDTARTYLEQSLARFQEMGHKRGETMLLSNMSIVYAETGDYRSAQRNWARAVELCEELDYPRGIAMALDNRGVAYLVEGNHTEAVNCFQRAHDINVQLDDAGSDGMCLYNMVRAYTAVHDHSRAVRASRDAIARFRQIENRRWEALVLMELGKTLNCAGHPTLAAEVLRAALVTMTQLADPQVEEIKAILETVHPT